MRRLYLLATWLLLTALVVCAARAQFFSPFQPPSSTPPVTYTGPGDIVSGASFWFGLRAYNAAYATGSNKSANIRRASDNTTQDINILSSGNFDTSTASTFCNATSCFITKLYDQTGNARNVSQATAADQPQLSFSCIGSLPCAVFPGSGVALGGVNCPVVTGVSDSAVSIRTSAFTSQGNIISCHAANNVLLAWWTTSGTITNFGGGTQIIATASNSVWHTIQAVYTSTTNAGVVNVDGTETTGTPGGGPSGSGLSIGNDALGGSVYLNGDLTEVGRWPLLFTSGNRSSLCHNQHVYWGTPTSC